MEGGLFTHSRPKCIVLKSRFCAQITVCFGPIEAVSWIRYRILRMIVLSFQFNFDECRLLCSNMGLHFFFPDIDECVELEDVCTNQGECENTFGSYKCVCTHGYRGNGTHCTGKLPYKFLNLYKYFSLYFWIIFFVLSLLC